MIQVPKPVLRIVRYELSDYEWSVIKPMLPNKPRGVPRVDDCRVLSGIFLVSRLGAPWRDLAEHYGPQMKGLATAHDARKRLCWQIVAMMPTGSGSSSGSKARCREQARCVPNDRLGNMMVKAARKP